MNIFLHDKSIDKIDQQIIRMLNKDGRQSYASIAAELNLAPSTVQQRANALIAKGILVIKGMVHPGDIGDLLIAMVAVEAQGSKIQQIALQLSEMPEVRWVVIATGQFDILMEVVCKDSNHLLTFLSEKLSCIEGVRDTETFPYLQITKKSWDWVLLE